MAVDDTGDLLFEPFRWNPVPGTTSVDLCPIVRRPSVTCSNTYILRSPWYIIIIDPGADPVQIQQIRSIVEECRSNREYPVFIFLTHCHIDHYLACNLLMDSTIGGRLVCHNLSADAIEQCDENVTLANMNGSALPSCSVTARFFGHSKPGQGSPAHLFSIEPGTVEISPGNMVPVESLAISENDRIDIVPTPGHSPDGLCYRIGSYMITGDNHLATTPGIAGKFGWDNRALTRSLTVITEKCRRDGLSLVLPGHGNAFPFEKAEKIFDHARKEAQGLTGLELFNRDRSLYVSEYAIVLLEEAATIFSTIAARLLKVSYYLELLDEEESAANVLNAIDTDTIETMVADFHAFVGELKGKRGAPLISKAVQFTRKVEKVFEPEHIANLFDSHFIRRIRGLLSDFVNVVYGIRYSYQETTFDLNDAVTETISEIKGNPFETESMIESVDDERKFTEALTRNISREPLFASLDITFPAAGQALLITADRLLFQDMLTALMEQLAISRVGAVTLSTGIDIDRTVLSVHPANTGDRFILRNAKTLYLQHTMRLAGGEFEKIVSDGLETYAYRFTPASDLQGDHTKE